MDEQPGHRPSGPFSTRPKFVILERHLVVEGKQDHVVEYYKDKVMPVLDEIPGYLGMAVLSGAVEDIKDSQGILGIGLPDNPFQKHAALRPDAGARTDLSIHFDSLLRGTYNLMFEHYLADDRAFHALHDDLENIWREKYGTDVWDELSDNYFVHFRNHWDTVYRFTDFA
jgi:hypothetical protein